MDNTELFRLARVGAEVRLASLQREIDVIYQRFPDLRPGQAVHARNPYTAGVRSAVAGVRGAVEGAVRRRSSLSPEGRKRISEAQKARWARQKAHRSANSAAGTSPRKRAAKSRKKK